MRINQRGFTILLGALVVVLAALAPAQQLPRKETLYIGGFQWGPPTNFNPIASGPAWPMGQTFGTQYVYETLFVYNLLTGNLDPQLAAKLDVKGNVFTITLQNGTRWQDGQPLTSADVVYTFDLAKRQQVSYAPF
ncbi:hypothetical protein EWH23_02110 [Meiothermus sp. PNK-Is4]|nr:hypothetical protein DNA98_10840 [Meiothermus sp. Pnk-1]RYM39987.1 hypothetical protein EWH23_02110 [Meiothermus sp. PNK-Is4]